MRAPKLIDFSGKSCARPLDPHAPPYIIWTSPKAIYDSYATSPYPMVGYSNGSIVTRACQYPTRSISYYSTRFVPPGFRWGPSVKTVI